MWMWGSGSKYRRDVWSCVCVYVGVGCLRLIPKLKMDMDVGLRL